MARRKTEIAEKLAEIERRIDSDDLLDAEQREEIKARAKEHVRKERIKVLTDQLFKEHVRLVETEQAEADQEILEITIDLPSFAFSIVLDNIAYFHGCTYDVPRGKYLSLLDQMARSYEHDREIHEQRRGADVARDPGARGVNLLREQYMSGQTGVTSTRSLRESMRR